MEINIQNGVLTATLDVSGFSNKHLKVVQHGTYVAIEGLKKTVVKKTGAKKIHRFIQSLNRPEIDPDTVVVRREDDNLVISADLAPKAASKELTILD